MTYYLRAWQPPSSPAREATLGPLAWKNWIRSDQRARTSQLLACRIPGHSQVPSGDAKIAIENDHRNSGFSH